MKIFYTTLFILIISKTFGQQYSIITREDIKAKYESAFLEIKGMLDGKTTSSFKRAVFLTESTFSNDTLTFQQFDKGIQFLASRCRLIEKQSNLAYPEKDKAQVQKNFAVFKLMSDTVKYYIDSTRYVQTFPFTYDFNDFWGELNWQQMFVTKLLRTGKGNCHSLPFLYKILEEEIGGKAYLALAPNHIYIKQQVKQGGWYNTELTSNQFPIDSWIMASGYIHLSAIQNGVYMDTLSNKQSLAVCLVDLAKGYDRKFPTDIEFLFKCADLALVHYPNYTNALILKAETKKKKFQQMMEKSNAKYASQMFDNPEAKNLFDEMEKLYLHIHQLGYRMMPKEMYMNWLVDLKRHKEKYENKEITNFKTDNRK
jgi:hypothetical protein